MGAEGQGAGNTGRWQASPRTLVFVTHRGRVLMMKRGPQRRIFPNKYNGLGGHVERGEDVYSSAAREVHEESGLTVRDLRLRGIHHIDVGADSGILMFVFTAVATTDAVSGSSDEGTLEWIGLSEYGALDLVDDVAEILPRALAMADDAPPYFAHVGYDEHDQIVIRYA